MLVGKSVSRWITASLPSPASQLFCPDQFRRTREFAELDTLDGTLLKCKLPGLTAVVRRKRCAPVICDLDTHLIIAAPTCAGWQLAGLAGTPGDIKAWED